MRLLLYLLLKQIDKGLKFSMKRSVVLSQDVVTLDCRACDGKLLSAGHGEVFGSGAARRTSPSHGPRRNPQGRQVEDAEMQGYFWTSQKVIRNTFPSVEIVRYGACEE